MATFTKVGYGQVEPNHLSAMRTGQIYAQLPCATGITTLENGTFVKYNYAAVRDGGLDGGQVEITAASGTGEWMLHMSEIKLYEPRQFAADFRLTAAETSDSRIYPRVYKTNVGDIITTNQIKDESVVDGNYMTVNGTTGILEVDAAPNTTEMVWKVVKLTTMPDGQPAVKLQRIQ